MIKLVQAFEKRALLSAEKKGLHYSGEDRGGGLGIHRASCQGDP